MQKIQIQHTRGYGDCEDCGSYEWAHLTLVAGERTLQTNYDGHLGGGSWAQGEMATAYLWALALAGFEVELIELADGGTLRLAVPEFYERVHHPEGYRDYELRTLLPAQPQLLRVPAPLVHPEQWEFEDARLEGREAPVPRTPVADDVYEGYLEPLLLALLRTHCELDLREDIQPYEEAVFWDDVPEDDDEDADDA